MRHKISLRFNKSALLVARTLRCAEKNQEATERRKDTEPRPSRRPGLSDQMRGRQRAPLSAERLPAALGLRPCGARNTTKTCYLLSGDSHLRRTDR